MHTTTRLLICAAASLLPATASADDAAAVARSTLDVYFVSQSDFEVSTPAGSAQDDGEGFGVRTLFLPGIGSAAITAGITAEYQANGYDSALDYDQVRVGVGLVHSSCSGVFFEIDQFEVEGDETNGVSAHGRLAWPFAHSGQVYADLAYLWLENDMEDLTGPEFTLGGALGDAGFGVFADYRVTKLEAEISEVEVEISDIRIGMRWGFGGGDSGG